MSDPKWMGRDHLGRKTVLYDDYLEYKQRSNQQLTKLRKEYKELSKAYSALVFIGGQDKKK